MGSTCCQQIANVFNNDIHPNEEGQEENIEPRTNEIQNNSIYQIEVTLSKLDTNLQQLIILREKIRQHTNNQQNPNDQICNFPTKIDNLSNKISDSINNIISYSKMIMEDENRNYYSEIQINQINNFANQIQNSAIIMVDSFARGISSSNYSNELVSYLQVEGPFSIKNSNKTNGQQNQSETFIQTNILSTGARF
ncbi:unnamed protein product (macronuclear) [Paramecium tetraurelia]|uniref:Uncharacterized protein n=1 Tax=Paramecium tetraurelia TaxID=5888 RepID=A0C164_PARTE|nr:uncharacterized protein GSPATT00034007001 [Paramecium tetraurelia]CAK64531.1 unnamed protein product [Paramecium tetraurelia]|eukprot:XP_001431929.1 hypothetical protein (macronuclear) [Paramecium tetraurelia strain d4-2]